MMQPNNEPVGKHDVAQPSKLSTLRNQALALVQSLRSMFSGEAGRNKKIIITQHEIAKINVRLREIEKQLDERREREKELLQQGKSTALAAAKRQYAEEIADLRHEMMRLSAERKDCSQSKRVLTDWLDSLQAQQARPKLPPALEAEVARNRKDKWRKELEGRAEDLAEILTEQQVKQVDPEVEEILKELAAGDADLSKASFPGRADLSRKQSGPVKASGYTGSPSVESASLDDPEQPESR